MPSPVFILVARTAVEDKATNFLSLFSVLEILSVTQAPPVENADPALVATLNSALRRANEFIAFAVWMREDAIAADVVYEHRFSLIFPNREDQLPATPFQFDAELPLQRFRLSIQGIPPIEESCIIYVQSLVRRPDTDETWHQRYPILCKVNRLQDQAANNGHADQHF
jgi:hypothetical protein